MIKKVISGGQVGADRLGLEAAKALGLETGGTAPFGYRTSNGPDMDLRRFGLVESQSSHYPPRTVSNVKDSDGTVIFAEDLLSRGVVLTRNTAVRLGRPFIQNPTPAEFKIWAEYHNIEVLNVAGNRSYEGYETIKSVLEAAIS